VRFEAKKRIVPILSRVTNELATKPPVDFSRLTVGPICRVSRPIPDKIGNFQRL